MNCNFPHKFGSDQPSYQERRAVISIIATILLYAAFWGYAAARLQAEGIPFTQDPAFWASTILVLIAVTIAVNIVIEIALHIAHAIQTGGRTDPLVSDERDEWIELKTNQVTGVVAGFGFVAAMTSLTLHQPPVLMIHILWASFHLAEIIASGAKLALYRRGA